ncbi:hypothetical protein ABIE26_001692 [Pedobacter africanus]|uniref:Uncharacterized protein n=1 Tax=Pedobacter africanus TaxID=151894 RepID=A0ACC6KRK5_9SPHI|nr:hypothetical protein [Pedobacter africanus]MDR6781820.1 hypothetical protein [Pedobacter africanus]
MLKGCLFENGSGVKLLGELSDLNALHCTVRKITSVMVDYGLTDTAASTLLVDFLEKIETAYSGKGLTEQAVFQHTVFTYYGFSCTWMELLMINSLLRSLADYTATDERDDVNMLLLEYLIRKAVSQLDKEELSGIHHYIGKPFVCLNIRHFIAQFNFNNADFEDSADRDSLNRIQEYLSAYFEGSKQHN